MTSGRKKVLFVVMTCALVAVISLAEAQDRVRKVGKGGRPVEIMAGLDEAASFRGQGEEGFKEWVTRNIDFPEECLRKGIQGTVLVGFNVDFDGRVVDVRVVNGYHPALDAEAVRVVSSSPDWTPAYKSGTRVKTPFTIPVVFEFNRVKEKTKLRPAVIVSHKTTPLQFVKTYPQFEGKDFNDFVRYFNRLVVYPYEAKRANLGGKVLLKFMIGGDNKLWGVTARGGRKILEDEVYRIMNYPRMMNGWTAGTEAGQNVNTECLMVVTFDNTTRSVYMTPVDSKDRRSLVYDEPQFLGDKNNDFRNFVTNNLRYPIVSQEAGIEGTVLVDFVINTRGKIDSVQILNSVDAQLDKEAIRVLRLPDASNWRPARYDNKPVNRHYVFPFIFSLDHLSPLEQIASDMLISPCEEWPSFNNRHYLNFFDFIDANIIDINPSEVEQKTVIISFILETTGRVSNVKNIGTIGYNVEMDEIEEAVRVVQLSEGYWTPAKGENGRSAPVQIIVPVRLYDKSRYEE